MILENDQSAEHNSAERDTTTETTTDRPERAERIDDRHHHRLRGKNRDIRSTIRDAFKTEAGPAEKQQPQRAKPDDQARDRGGKFAASPSQKEVPPAEKPSETAASPAIQTQEKIAAPVTAPKEVHAIWDKLPQEAQTIFAKREADMLKGVDQLKAKYKPIDDAFAPYQPQLKHLGKTESDAVKQLLEWQAALADPRTQARAFQALAQSHRFDLKTLIAPQSAQGQQPDQNQQPDPTQAFRPLLDPIAQRVQGLESEIQRRDRERVQSDIAQMSKDKPHFDKVRLLMGQLINSGMIQGDNPKEVFDEAYARACRADPEVFALIQQEEQEKKAAEAKAAEEAAAKEAAEKAETDRKKRIEEIAKARKAASPRSGAPTGMAIAASKRGKSVGDTVREAVQSARGTI